MNPTEFTDLHKLYTINLSITDKAPSSKNSKTLFEVPLVIFANNKWRRDGQWGTSTVGASLMGASSGFWTIGDKPSWKNKYLLSLFEEEPPNAVANFFGADLPSHLGMLELVPKFPIPIGTSGEGFYRIKAPGTKAGSDNYRYFIWKVQERRF
jgi:hypothetical protein